MAVDLGEEACATRSCRLQATMRSCVLSPSTLLRTGQLGLGFLDLPSGCAPKLELRVCGLQCLSSIRALLNAMLACVALMLATVFFRARLMHVILEETVFRCISDR